MGKRRDYVPYLIAAAAFSPLVWNYFVRPYILNGHFYHYWKPLACIGAWAVGLLLYLKVKNKAWKKLISTTLFVSFFFYPWIFGWEAPLATPIAVLEIIFFPIFLYFVLNSFVFDTSPKTSPPIDEQIEHLENQIKKLLAKKNLSEKERLKLIDLQVRLSKLYEKKGFKKGYDEGFITGYSVGSD